jgi:hypothetical protein
MEGDFGPYCMEVLDMDDRSPLKQKPLRNPGQSVDEEIDRLVNDKLLGFLLFPMMFWIFAWMEWIQRLLKAPRSPAIYAATATLFTIVAAYQFWRLRKRVRNLKLGRDGEREVAEVLETLKEQGAQVIHDVPCNKFNSIMSSFRPMEFMPSKPRPGAREKIDRGSSLTASA